MLQHVGVCIASSVSKSAGINGQVRCAEAASDTLYFPRLDEADEHWPGGYLELGEPSYRGRQSIVYPIRDNPSLFLKYQADCEEMHDKKLHPLLLEFWYGKKASAF